MLQSTRKTTEKASDQDLIKAARKGDPRGFEQLVLRYQSRLFISVRSSVECPVLAEDIVQEAFMKAFQYLDSFKLRSEFYTWLYRIALNSRRTHFRRMRRTFSLESVDKGSLPEREPSWESPTHRAERDEQQDQVRSALASIEEHHRLILTLREFDELDYQSIANVLDVKIGTVRSRLARARARLRTELARQEKGHEMRLEPASFSPGGQKRFSSNRRVAPK